jgi:hypothetical protein
MSLSCWSFEVTLRLRFETQRGVRCRNKVPTQGTRYRLTLRFRLHATPRSNCVPVRLKEEVEAAQYPIPSPLTCKPDICEFEAPAHAGLVAPGRTLHLAGIHPRHVFRCLDAGTLGVIKTPPIEVEILWSITHRNREVQSFRASCTVPEYLRSTQHLLLRHDYAVQQRNN